MRLPTISRRLCRSATNFVAADSARCPRLAVPDSGARYPSLAADALRVASGSRWGRRRRHRIVRLGAQIDDQIGALVGVLDPGRRHLGAGNIALRPGQEFLEFVERPLAPFGLHGPNSRTADGRLLGDRPHPRDSPDVAWRILFRRMAGHADPGFRLRSPLLIEAETAVT